MSNQITAKKDTIWTRNFIILFFASTVTSAGAGMTHALLGLYSKSLGANDSLVGVVSGIFALTALAMRPISGPAIDAWNKKKLYLVTITMNAVAMFGYGISTNIPMIIFFRLMHGICNGTSAALCLAMATESLPEDKIASGISMYMLSHVIPSAVGPGIGLAISERWGYPVTYMVSAGVIILATFVGAKLDYSNHQPRKLEIKLDTIVAKEAVIPAIIIMIMKFGSCTVDSFLVLMTDSKGIAGISTYYTINAVAAIISRPMAGTLADKYGAKKILFPTLALFMINLVLLSQCNSTIMLWISAVLHAFGYTAFYSMLQAYAMKVTPANKRGAGGSTCYIGTDTGALLGPMLAGVIANRFGYSILYLYGLIPLVICAVIMYFWLIKSKAAKAV